MIERVDEGVASGVATVAGVLVKGVEMERVSAAVVTVALTEPEVSLSLPPSRSQGVSSGIVYVLITEDSTDRTAARCESGKERMLQLVRLTARAAAGSMAGAFMLRGVEFSRAASGLEEALLDSTVCLRSLVGARSRCFAFCTAQQDLSYATNLSHC